MGFNGARAEMRWAEKEKKSFSPFFSNSRKWVQNQKF
jgi:hypothetical protein